MNRQAQSVVLLLVGGAVLRASLTDLYLNYVKAGLRPFLIVAGALLVVAAVMTLWYELRSSPDPADPAAAADDRAEPTDGEWHDHDHDGSGPRVAWLLIFPVLGLLLVAPPALGSYAAGRSGTALTEKSDFAPLPDGDPAKISMLDYASRAVFDEGRSIGDRRVQLTGFLMAGPDGTLLLTRMIVSCCAADARPIKVALAGEVPDGLAPDSWLQVVGEYSERRIKDTVNGETIPFIEVVDAKPIPAPAEQYES